MRIITDLMEPSRLGGIEVTLLEDVRGLVAAGHEVHVVHGPCVHRPPPGDLHADLLATGAQLHGPLGVRWTPERTPSDLLGYTASTRLLHRLRPDVVWVQRFEHLLWAHAARSTRRTPVLCHLHHAPMYRRPVQRLLAAGIGGHLAVSEFTRRQWVDAGLPPERVRVLHNALPAGAYPPGGAAEAVAARASLGLPADARVVLLYGLLSQAKGAGVVARAWEELQAAEPSAHLLVAGEAPPGVSDGGLVAVVEAAVAAGRATRLGAQRDVVPLLHAADVVLFPSLLPESFGRVPLEAITSGRPVVASSVGAVPEVLTGAAADLLVPPADPAALAGAVRRLLRWRETDPGLGDRLADELTSRFDPVARLARLQEELARAAS